MENQEYFGQIFEEKKDVDLMNLDELVQEKERIEALMELQRKELVDGSKKPAHSLEASEMRDEIESFYARLNKVKQRIQEIEDGSSLKQAA